MFLMHYSVALILGE